MPAAKKTSKSSTSGRFGLKAESGKYTVTGVAPRFDVVRLSDPAMKKGMGELRQRIAADPEVGKKLLRKAGIVTAKGNLTKRYGG